MKTDPKLNNSLYTVPVSVFGAIDRGITLSGLNNFNTHMRHIWYSMGWLKGKSTGNHRISEEMWEFPVIFPLNQLIEDVCIFTYITGWFFEEANVGTHSFQHHGLHLGQLSPPKNRAVKFGAPKATNLEQITQTRTYGRYIRIHL